MPLEARSQDRGFAEHVDREGEVGIVRPPRQPSPHIRHLRIFMCIYIYMCTLYMYLYLSYSLHVGHLQLNHWSTLRLQLKREIGDNKVRDKKLG